MKINAKILGDICVLELEGEVDAEHSSQFKQAIAKAQKEKSKKFVLDFQKVSFIDSTGLGVLISLKRSLAEQGGELRLANLQEEVHSIFEITRLFRVFDLCASVEGAIKDIQKNKK